MANQESKTLKEAPKWLRIWFVIHFIADMTFAVPLMLFPVQFLVMLGWTSVDPISTRLVAAALFGIGIESLLGRNATIDSFKTMLNLKIIWSSTAVIGILLSMLFTQTKAPLFGWVFLGVFAAFNILWIYWRTRIGKMLL